MEDCQPRPALPPAGILKTLTFFGHVLTNFNFLRVYKDVRRFLSAHRGEILDVGCGGGPFRFLVDRAGSHYRGVDTPLAEDFGYDNPDILQFGEGSSIPLPDASIDAILCTEVLEHVEEPLPLIAEMHRVLRPGASALITLPWSARYHYIPHDYYRYTPSRLRTLFRSFASVEVIPQGTDITSIVGKISVIFVRNVQRTLRGNILSLVISILVLPFFAIGIVVGHLSLLLHIGSTDDPLGYAVIVRR